MYKDNETDNSTNTKIRNNLSLKLLKANWWHEKIIVNVLSKTEEIC